MGWKDEHVKREQTVANSYYKVVKYDTDVLKCINIYI